MSREYYDDYRHGASRKRRKRPVVCVEANDPPLDQGLIDLEIRRVFTVIGSNLIGGNERIDALLDQMLVELTDQQRLAVLLDQRIDVLLGIGEKFFGLVQFKLFVHPLFDITVYESHAVLADHSLRNRSLNLSRVQFSTGSLGQHDPTSAPIAGHFLAPYRKYEQQNSSYFGTKTHNYKGQR